ncbi:MAG: Na/Pi cotransporter family protein, partial [Lentisphaerae bacterium]|nr:Na/Pi cotransporter family protein [Lentisphaerota bacterium]
MQILTVFGGLALFIYGMKLMGDGLHKSAGSRMRSILHFFSSNRFVAILSGTVVTAVIQSSSATTVMVVGFINAGLLNLMQAIGIIFGANIGTTVTAQIIAFDIEWLIMPAIILGVLLCFITHHAWRGCGDTVLGFGLLFFGMSIMSSELKNLAQDPDFIALFQTFNCAPRDGSLPPGAVFGAIGIGMLVTMIIQSSSACSGIVIALGASGLVDL